jgi:flagellar biosynthetic protein FlhB
MMQAVPTADVIIRNPTHFAVALRYDLEKDSAPMLVAKGQDELALRIVAVGEENGVYVLENKPLARGIFASTQVGAEIPPEYYGMVAEILVYVYRMNNKIIE